MCSKSYYMYHPLLWRSIGIPGQKFNITPQKAIIPTNKLRVSRHEFGTDTEMMMDINSVKVAFYPMILVPPRAQWFEITELMSSCLTLVPCVVLWFKQVWESLTSLQARIQGPIICDVHTCVHQPG